MRAHGCKPLRGVENLPVFTVFRRIDDGTFISDLRDRHVLLVDTIVDTGRTLDHIFHVFSERGPASLGAVALLNKKTRWTVFVPLQYIGVVKVEK